MCRQPRELSPLFVLVGRAQFPHPQFCQCTLSLARGGPLQGFQALQPLPSLTAATRALWNAEENPAGKAGFVPSFHGLGL